MRLPPLLPVRGRGETALSVLYVCELLDWKGMYVLLYIHVTMLVVGGTDIISWGRLLNDSIHIFCAQKYSSPVSLQANSIFGLI